MKLTNRAVKIIWYYLCLLAIIYKDVHWIVFLLALIRLTKYLKNKVYDSHLPLIALFLCIHCFWWNMVILDNILKKGLKSQKNRIGLEFTNSMIFIIFRQIDENHWLTKIFKLLNFNLVVHFQIEQMENNMYVLS